MIWRVGALLIVKTTDGFALLDERGAVVRHYYPRAYSDEDDLWHWEHAVAGDRFVARTRVEHAGKLARQDDEVLHVGLVPADDPATRAMVATILGDDSVVQEEHRLAAERAGNARIAAITGGVTAGGELARAQAALEHRVRAYDDQLAAALLATLLEVAHAGPAVIAAYARGCRLACFEGDVPPLVDGPPAPAGALAVKLAELAARLGREAEWQDDIDARNTAIAYRAAAEAIAHAAALAR